MKKALKYLTSPFFALLVAALVGFGLGWISSNIHNHPDTIAFEIHDLSRDWLAIEKCKTMAGSVPLDGEVDEAIEIGGTYEEVMLSYAELKENKQAEVYKDCIDKL